MRMGHYVQADVTEFAGRFWMDSCAGRDQVAMAVLSAGWAGYEAPLPRLVATWCSTLCPLFVDIGANTGFYSLLACATGARRVCAFEPMSEIARMMQVNVRMSEFDELIDLSVLALGEREGMTRLWLPVADHGLVETSASENRAFRARHAGCRDVTVRRLDDAVHWSLAGPGPVVIKIDVETSEPAVLRGAAAWLREARPAVVCEVLPETDLTALAAPLAQAQYRHFELSLAADGVHPVLTPAPEIRPDRDRRDHVFLPHEAMQHWLEPWPAAGGHPQAAAARTGRR